MEITNISALNGISSASMQAVSVTGVVRPPGQNTSKPNTQPEIIGSDASDLNQFPSLEVLTRRIVKAMHEAMKKADEQAAEDKASARRELAHRQLLRTQAKEAEPKLIGQSKPAAATDPIHPTNQSTSPVSDITDSATAPPSTQATTLPNGKDLLADAKFSLSQASPSDLQMVHMFDSSVNVAM